jgi:hypothetical protein
MLSIASFSPKVAAAAAAPASDAGFRSRGLLVRVGRGISSMIAIILSSIQEITEGFKYDY